VFARTTFSAKACSLVTLSRASFGIMAFGIMAFGQMTFSGLALSRLEYSFTTIDKMLLRIIIFSIIKIWRMIFCRQTCNRTAISVQYIVSRTAFNRKVSSTSQNYQNNFM
jgi:hypothetical protein